jgi:hypothetical protein
MSDQPKKQPRLGRDEPARREERLAAALKANLARRKAQARQRARYPAGGPEEPETHGR